MVPIFSLFGKNKFHFKDPIAFELSSPSQGYSLTSNIAPIFATFGHKDPRYYLSLSMKNEPVLALIDSGSSKTYVGEKAAKLLGNFRDCSAFMTAANNNSVKVDGSRLVNFNLGNEHRTIPTRYIKSLQYDCIFGFDSLCAFGLLVDFHTGMCSLPGGKSWKVDFPEPSGNFAAVIDSISAIDATSDSRFFLNVNIKGKKVTALVDSGSTRTYLGPAFEPILKDSLIPVSASVLLADNSIEPVLGEFNSRFSLGGERKSLPVRLVHSLYFRN